MGKVLAYDSLAEALAASQALGGAVEARGLFIGLLFGCRDGVPQGLGLPGLPGGLPLSFKPLLNGPVLRLCPEQGTCQALGEPRVLDGVAVSAALVLQQRCATKLHCYRISMRFDGKELLKTRRQPEDWDQEEDGPWVSDLACVARYFQFLGPHVHIFRAVLFKVLYREWPPCSIWTVACECYVQLGGYSSNFSSLQANFQRSARYGMTPLRPRNV